MAAFQAFLQAMGGMGTGAAGADGSAGSEAELSAMLAQMAKLSSPGGDEASPSALAAASAASPAAAASSSSAAASDPVADAVRLIAEGAKSMPPGAAAAAGFDMNDPTMDALLSKLLREMGGDAVGGSGGASGAEGSAGAGSDDGMERMVEQMMGSMLSREHLYQPMKDIAERYPAYLRDNAESISEADMTNYRKQQACFERIVAEFDAPGGGKTMRIMELMNEMQQYGTPPSEIVSNFQPPGFDPNAPLPPGMAGLAGLAGAGAGADASGMPPMDDALLQQLAKDDACKTQ